MYPDGAPEGKSLIASQAIFEIDNLKIQADVNDDQPYAVLEAKLRKGSYKLKSKFISSDAREFPVYYTTIESIDPK